MHNLNIIIAGVGGQGTLLASRILGRLAMLAGYDVKVSEVHGMSQRGGSVITYIRMGEKVYAPLIEQEGADYCLAFEELEALRVLPYLHKDSTMIVNTQRIMPMPVITGAEAYPENSIDRLKEKTHVRAIDGLKAAQSLGNERMVNIVLLGVLAKMLPFEKKLWEDALVSCIPERFYKANRAAFELGYKA